MKLNLNEINYILCETIKLLTEITIKDAYKNHYSTLSPEFYSQIISKIQPEQKNILLPITKWVLGVAKENPKHIEENLELLCNDEGTGVLQIYQRLVTLGVLNEREKNIMNFKTIDALEAITSQFNPDDLWGNNSERKKRVLRSDFINAKNEVELIYEDKNWLVLTPKSYEASVYWGHGTSWCTAYKDDKSYYEQYTANGPLYININVKTGEKYQFHFPTSSFKDKGDDNITGESSIFNIIKASKGMIAKYKEILPQEEFVCLNAEPNSIVYENDYFQVRTLNVGCCNDILNNGDAENLSVMPMSMFAKEGGYNLVRYEYTHGFSNFFVINDNEFLLTTQMKMNEGGQEGYALLHVLTLEEIMENGVNYNVGKAYYCNDCGEWECQETDELGDTYDTERCFWEDYPQFKPLVKKIMNFIGVESDEINL